MLNDLVPSELQSQLADFQQDLAALSLAKITVCPFCQSDKLSISRKATATYRCRNCGKYSNPLTGTPFNYLHPAQWLAKILTMRIEYQSYFMIAEQLDTTPEKIKRRNQAIIAAMQQRYPALANWYIHHQDRQTVNPLTPVISQQHQAFTAKVNDLLTTTQADCPYCQSSNTVKIGNRTGFRCKHCKKTFNLLSQTRLNRMPYCERWIPFIDLLVAGKNDKQIVPILQLNHNTVSKWRRYWCVMMQSGGFDALALWCRRTAKMAAGGGANSARIR